MKKEKELASSKLTIENKAMENVLSGERDVAFKIGKRDDYIKKMLANTDVRTIKARKDLAIRPMAVPLQAMMGAFQRGEAAIANPAMAMQDFVKNVQEKGFIRGSGSTMARTVGGVVDAISGKKLGELGDVYQRAGIHPAISAGLGLLTSAGVSEVASAGRLSSGVARAMPKVYTDKVMAREGRNIVNVLTEKVNGIRESYKKVYEPFYSKIVDGKVFSQLKHFLPPKLQKEVERMFSSGIIQDVAGNKSTDIGKLISLRSWLDDMVKMSPGELSRLKINYKQLKDVSQMVKQVILQHLPKDKVDEIAKLDDIFSKVYTKANAWLKKLHDPKTDSIKTEFLAKIFKNPDSAGVRTALKELGNVGMDVNKSLKIFQGYATRQGIKKALGLAAPSIIAAKIIGSSLSGSNKKAPEAFADFTNNVGGEQ